MRPARARALLLALPALLAVATAAHAAGVSLRWNDCYGDGGVQNKNFACDTNAGSQTLVGSFTLGADLAQVSGNEIELYLASASVPLPQWWQFKNTGSCRRTSMTVTLSGSVPCLDWANGQAAGGISAYNIGFLGANTARVIMASTVLPTGPQDLSGGQEYFSFSLNIDNQKTVGTGSCAGCSSPVCLVMHSIDLTTPVVANNVLLTGPAYGLDSDWATWQGGAGVVTGGGSGCPAATPAATRTWGAVKALYR